MKSVKAINVTFDEMLSKAREWYNSGNSTPIELALKAFTENDLNQYSFNEIKSFEDACNVFGINYNTVMICVNYIAAFSKASAAMFKLNIVRKALNSGQDLHLTMDAKCSFIHYPCNPFVTESSTYYEDDINSGRIEIIGKIKSEGTLYDVLGGYTDEGGVSGFGSFNFYHDVGFAPAGASAASIVAAKGRSFRLTRSAFSLSPLATKASLPKGLSDHCRSAFDFRLRRTRHWRGVALWKPSGPSP